MSPSILPSLVLLPLLVPQLPAVPPTVTVSAGRERGVRFYARERDGHLVLVRERELPLRVTPLASGGCYTPQQLHVSPDGALVAFYELCWPRPPVVSLTDLNASFLRQTPIPLDWTRRPRRVDLAWSRDGRTVLFTAHFDAPPTGGAAPLAQCWIDARSSRVTTDFGPEPARGGRRPAAPTALGEPAGPHAGAVRPRYFSKEEMGGLVLYAEEELPFRVKIARSQAALGPLALVPSEDGKRLAYVVRSGGQDLVYVASPRTGARRRLFAARVNPGAPLGTLEWSGDGRTLLLTERAAPGPLDPEDVVAVRDVYHIDAATGRLRFVEGSPIYGGRQEGGRIYRAHELAQPAKVIAMPDPVTTQAAKAHKVRGATVVQMVLLASGEVMREGMSFRGYIPYGILDRVAAAASKIEFEPAVKDGLRVAQWLWVRYELSPSGWTVREVPEP